LIGLILKNGRLELHVLLTISGCPMKDRLRTDVTSAVSSIEGVSEIDLTFGVMSDKQRDNVKSLLRNGREKFIPFAQPDSLTRVLGVASGKGGVGKSSVTANLAIAAAKQGLKLEFWMPMYMVIQFPD
jgi:ATP-binding protein involved in chromosome partitioning